MDIYKTSLGDMQLFVELAKLGSLREVARSRQMEVAQLSRSLKRFEERVGRRLFERSPRGLLLTPEGLSLRASVEKVLEELGLDFGGYEVATEKGKVPYIDGIGAPSFLMNDLALPLVGNLKQREFIAGGAVVELPPDRLVLSGLRGIVMMGLHAGKLEWPQSWVSERVGTLRWGLYGAKKYFPRTTLSVTEVMKLEFVYPVYWSPEGLRDTEDRLSSTASAPKACGGCVVRLDGLRSFGQVSERVFSPLDTPKRASKKSICGNRRRWLGENFGTRFCQRPL
jgi:DNA-binding transcriptional LysR family regulator